MGDLGGGSRNFPQCGENHESFLLIVVGRAGEQIGISTMQSEINMATKPPSPSSTMKIMMQNF